MKPTEAHEAWETHLKLCPQCKAAKRTLRFCPRGDVLVLKAVSSYAAGEGREDFRARLTEVLTEALQQGDALKAEGKA